MLSHSPPTTLRLTPVPWLGMASWTQTYCGGKPVSHLSMIPQQSATPTLCAVIRMHASEPWTPCCAVSETPTQSIIAWLHPYTLTSCHSPCQNCPMATTLLRWENLRVEPCSQCSTQRDGELAGKASRGSQWMAAKRVSCPWQPCVHGYPLFSGCSPLLTPRP